MKKIILSTIVAMTLGTNLIAEVKPYMGLSYNSFGIYSNDVTATNKTTGDSYSSTVETRDGGSAIGLNAGAILNNNSKVNFAYFSGKEENSELLKTTVIAISYDYSFNNKGIRRGWYIGAGISSIKTEIEENTLLTSTSTSETGLLLRGGYEYQINNNLLFDIGYNSHLAEQKLKYDYKTSDNIEGSMSTSISNLSISVNYIF